MESIPHVPKPEIFLCRYSDALRLLIIQAPRRDKGCHENQTGHQPERLHDAHDDEGVGTNGMEQKEDQAPQITDRKSSEERILGEIVHTIKTEQQQSGEQKEESSRTEETGLN